MQRIPFLAVLSLVLVGCGETRSPTAPAAAVGPSFISAPTVTEAPFFAVALCESDIGFNVLFGGERVLMQHTTTDASGKSHTTLHFRAQDFQGWRTTATVPPRSAPTGAPDFQVQGGAEMFATQTDRQGNIVVQIHQGNLVFESLSGDFRVVAHHTIRQVPGQGRVSFWRCRSVG